MSSVLIDPASLTLRAPTPDDLPAVYDLIVACDIADFGIVDLSLDDLRDEWDELDLARDAWVFVAADGGVVGYGAVFHKYHVRVYADGYVHPDAWGQGIGTRLQELMETRAREHVPLAPPDARVVLRNSTNAHDTQARRLLESHGYQLVRHFWRMEIDLDTPPPAPLWPTGIEARSLVVGQDELAAFTAISESFRDHWGMLPDSFEAWRKRTIDKPDFDPSLWFIAFAGGEVAGAVRCEYRLGDGWVHALGVRRPWRRRGLGNALLLQAFGEFYRRGTRRVGLGVDAASPTGATHLYERAGMHVSREFAVYEIELRPGRDLEAMNEL